MHSETVSYEADGLHMRGQLYAKPGAPEPRPGVLVYPEAFGLGEHAMSRAQALAELGYVALACDFHGNREIHHDRETLGGLLGPLHAQPERIRDRARAGLDVLRARPDVDVGRIAAIGFCFGGTMALELARGGAAMACVVGFHSGLGPLAPKVEPGISAKVLVCLGADDPTTNLAQRNAFEEEMRGAGIDWQMHVYGGVVHSFTNPAADTHGMPDFLRYDASADRRSWAAMRALFDDIFS